MDMKEWAEQIPMDELWAEIRHMTGLPDLKFSHTVADRNGSVRIYFESQDLVDKVGFLKLMFREIKIERFNSEVRRKNDDDDRETGEYFYWGTAAFSYTHPGGGSNCCTFLAFQYDDRKGWEFY